MWPSVPILGLRKVPVFFILHQILSPRCCWVCEVCCTCWSQPAQWFIQSPDLMGAPRDFTKHWYPAKMMFSRNHLSTNCRGVFGSNTAVGKDSLWAGATGNNSAFYCRRKSKQALRDYKKVQIQLENLETSVRDRCKKEFTGQSLSSWFLAASQGSLKNRSQPNLSFHSCILVWVAQSRQ